MTATSENPGESLILAFVSGKGGVGKTMLAVSAARELSRTRRTLLIDLDFFNRGLTGLMPEGQSLGTVQPPAFFEHAGDDNRNDESASEERWELREVCSGLVHIDYPDITPTSLQYLETMGTESLSSALRDFITTAAKQARCDYVVLDCHGGPDATSFAACVIADHALLVSEPDRITFYGTMNFVRQLQRVIEKPKFKLHLIFNKVVPAFSGFFLQRLYDEEIRSYFDDRPLLAIFPLEIYLTKAFEETPFLSDTFPDSWLAKKTNLLLCDLLSEEHKPVPATARGLPRWLRWWQRHVVGNSVPGLSLESILPVIAIGCLALMAGNLILSKFFIGTVNLVRVEDKLLLAVYKLETIRFSSQHPGLIIITNELNCLETPLYDSGASNSTEQSSPFLIRYELVNQSETNRPLTNLVSRLDNISQQYNVDIRSLLAARDEWQTRLSTNFTVSPEFRIQFTKALHELKDPAYALLLPNHILEAFGDIFAEIALCWFAFVLWLDWWKRIDRKFVYFSRIHRPVPKFGMLSVGVLLWGIAIWFAMDVIWNEYNSNMLPAAIIFGLGFLVLIVQQCWKIIRNFVFDLHRNEALCRIALLLVLLFISVLVGINGQSIAQDSITPD